MGRHMVERFQGDGAGSLSSITGIILAGGASRRMGGVNKALLTIGGRTVIERIVSVLARVFRDVIVVTNSPKPFHFLGLPTYPDIIPGRGSLGGLLTGLHRSGEQGGFLVACDMPFLNDALIRRMIGLVAARDVVIPSIDGMLEPLHAFYSKRCIPHIQALLEADDLKIIHLLTKVDMLEVPEEELIRIDPNLRFAMNVNTPEDFEKAERLARQIDGTDSPGA